MRFLVIAIFFFVAGCGYHTPGVTDSWVGGKARTVYVQLFDNMTAEPYLDHYLTEALVSRFSRSRTVIVTEDEKRADLRLVGSIVRFESNALAYGLNDRITDYRAEMTVSTQLVGHKTDKVFWQESFQATEDYLASVDKNVQLESQRKTAKMIAERIAEDIYTQMFNTF